MASRTTEYLKSLVSELRKLPSEIEWVEFKCNNKAPQMIGYNDPQFLEGRQPEMGAPIAGFVAATNSNRTIPDWIATGDYNARPSVETFANAMDVGAPSNYERIKAMYTLDQVREMFGSYWTDNEGIKDGIKKCNDKTGYIIDPHGAIGYQAWEAIKNDGFPASSDYEKPGVTANTPSWATAVENKTAVGVILETANPAKFGNVVCDAIGREPPVPQRLIDIMNLPDQAVSMENDYEKFKAWLLANLQSDINYI